MGAECATRLKSETLYRVIAVLLVVIAGVLLVAHHVAAGSPLLGGWMQIVVGIVAGLIISVVASLLGVAGGEVLIPTLILLVGADIKLAGSLSLAVSLPAMLVGFARYSRDQSFSVLRWNSGFLAGRHRQVAVAEQDLDDPDTGQPILQVAVVVSRLATPSGLADGQGFSTRRTASPRRLLCGFSRPIKIVIFFS